MRSLLIVLTSLLLLASCQTKSYQYNTGKVFGTYFHFVYASDVDLQPEIEQLLDSFSQSLSTYDKTSVISKINQNHEFKTDSFFRVVFRKSEEIFQLTNGAFDITVAPLVNAWGFGFSNEHDVDQLLIDSLLNFVGMEKVRLVADTVVKQNPAVMLDASAIAKGYSSDVVADFLRKNGVTNFMVEIGGEIVTSGVNPKGLAWKLGIDKPFDDPMVSSRELQMVVTLSGESLATSGNYRNFYIKDGKKYAHTIHPKTGYPVEHNLLSASIIAPDCMQADAFATACMVIGLEKSFELIESLPNVEGCFIFHTESGNQVTLTSGFEKFVSE